MRVHLLLVVVLLLDDCGLLLPGRRSRHGVALKGSSDHLRRLLLLLVDGAGGVQSISGRLGRVGVVRVEAVLCRRTSAGRGREAARAALDAARCQARCCRRVWNLKWESLHALPRDLLVLGMVHGSGSGSWVRVRVHRRHTGIVLFSHKKAVLGQAGCPLQHVHWMLLLRLRVLVNRCLGVMVGVTTVVLVSTARGEAVPVVELLLEAIAAHLLTKVGKGGGAVKVMRVVVHDGQALRWPLHRAAFGGCGRVFAARVRHGIVDLGRVNSSLVRAPLVLHHCCLSAETINQLVLDIPSGIEYLSLTSSSSHHGHTYTAVYPCGYGGAWLNLMTTGGNRCQHSVQLENDFRSALTSEKRFPQPIC